MDKRKILIVDDEAGIRDMLSTFFVARGYETVAVESGLLGLSLLAKIKFDILISDIRMPHMDGIEFVHKAARLDPDLIVILLTGYSSFDTAQEAIRIGVHDYLTKPVELNKLRNVVDAGLARVAEKKKHFEYYIEVHRKLQEDKIKLDSLRNELMVLIGHELRTPITVIATGFDVLKDVMSVTDDEKAAGLSDEQKMKIFNSIEKGRRRLSSIINDISYFMEIDKKESLNKTSVNLNKFLKDNFDGLKRLPLEGGSTLKKEIPDEEQTADIDKEKILDALARLINNATYHNPEGCEIVIKLSSITRKKDPVQQQDFSIIEISDNGQGIDSKMMENIFTPFIVGDIEHHSRGLGLGLAICKKVAELHGGVIIVESIKTKGTTVRLELPKS